MKFLHFLLEYFDFYGRFMYAGCFFLVFPLVFALEYYSDNLSETYLELSRRSMMELFCENS